MKENQTKSEDAMATRDEPTSNLQTLLPSPGDQDFEENIELENKYEELHLDDVLSTLRFGWFQIKILTLVGGGYFAVCAEFMLFVFLSSSARAEWHLAEYEFPWLPFSSRMAGIAGGFVFGTVSDRIGRRVPFIVGMTCVAVFGLASAFADSFPLFVAFRCVVTFGAAAFKCVGFVLLLEFLPRERRGMVMVVVTLCGALGAVLVASLAWGMLESLGWRWFVGTCATPAWLVLAMAACLVRELETPRFLLSSGQADRGLKILQRIAAQNKTCFTDGKIMCPQTSQRGSLWQLFTGDLRWRTVAVSLFWFLQATGYWGVTTYLPEYLASQGADPFFNMFSVFIGEIPGLILAMILIEKRSIGRINCLRMFSAITLIALVAFAFVSLDQLRTFFAIVVYFSMVPIFSVLNTFTPEVYPTSIRSIAMGWVNVVMEVPGLMTAFVGEFLLSSAIPWLYPVVWSAVFALQLATTWGLGKETAGKDLEDGRHKSKVQNVSEC